MKLNRFAGSASYPLSVSLAGSLRLAADRISRIYRDAPQGERAPQREYMCVLSKSAVSQPKFVLFSERDAFPAGLFKYFQYCALSAAMEGVLCDIAKLFLRCSLLHASLL